MLTGGKEERLALSALDTEGGTQIRAAFCERTAEQYKADCEEHDCEMGRLWIVRGEDEDGLPRQWVIDGFHRLHAYKALGRTHADCLVWERPADPYTVHDARRMALGTNRPSLNLTVRDKQRMLLMALENPQMAAMSNRALALELMIAHTTVNTVRANLEDGLPPFQKRKGQDAGEGARAEAARSEEPREGPREAARSGGSPPPPRGAAKEAPETASAPAAPDESVPPHLRDVFASGHAQNAVALCSKARLAFEAAARALDGPRILYDLARRLPAYPHARKNWRKLEAWLDEARDQIDDAALKLCQVEGLLEHCVPHAVCPTCKGLDPECPLCDGAGWLSERMMPLARAAVGAVVGEDAPEDSSGEEAA